MKTKKFVCGIAALILTALVTTGCPAPTTEGTTYILNGTVKADIGNVDYTKVSVQLIQNGSPKFKPVHPAKDGSFEISGVPAGEGFIVQATMDGFAIAKTGLFNVPEAGAGLMLQLKKLKQRADISGSITVDEDGIDITSVDVILYYMEGELKRMHPNADGTYVFTGIDQNESPKFKVGAELAGFYSTASQLFALTGNYEVPALAMSRPAPKALNAEYCRDQNNKEIILYFDRPVRIDGPFKSSTFAIGTNPPMTLTFVSMEEMDASGEKWVLTLDQEPPEVYNLLNIVYKGSMIKEKNGTQLVKGFNLGIKTVVAGIKIMDASIQNVLPEPMRLIRLSLIFNVNIKPESISLEGWSLVGSVSGNIELLKPQPLQGTILMWTVKPEPAAGETLLLSYTAPEGGGLEGINGTALENFKDLEVELR